ncbi:MAG: hypothetical protein EON54_27615 [Alcaligenaceae bacterium]|nr:MAG: hypothetical protein EON54_27615 [Alcaligenaceae bacterium]
MSHFPLAVRPYLGPCYLTASAVSFGDTPAENSEASGASEVKDGRGVSTLTETDLSLLRTLESRYVAHAVLNAKVFGMKTTPWRDALIVSWQALDYEIHARVRQFKEWGMLLHVGCVK